MRPRTYNLQTMNGDYVISFIILCGGQYLKFFFLLILDVLNAEYKIIFGSECSKEICCIVSFIGNYPVINSVHFLDIFHEKSSSSFFKKFYWSQFLLNFYEINTIEFRNTLSEHSEIYCSSR